MQKVLRDDINRIAGYADTTKPRGSYTEFCDVIGYTKYLTVSETMKAADPDTYYGGLDKGELY